MKKIILGCALFFLSNIAFAQLGPFLYQVETNWLVVCDAATPLITEDFEGSSAGGGSFCGPILSSTSSNCFPIGELEDGFNITANNGGSTFYGPPGQVGANQDVPVVGVGGGQGQYTVVTFTTEVTRVALDIFGISSSPGDGIIRVYDTDDVLIDTYDVNIIIGDFNFFGIHSSRLIGKIELEDPDDGEGLFFGNLRFGKCVVNDDPDTAITLTVGDVFEDASVTNDNSFASDSQIIDPTLPAPGCANYNGGDVWFTTIVPANGALNIETRLEDGSPLLDTGLAIYTEDLTTILDCDDDDGNNTFSLITLTDRTPGEILLIRVWEYDGNLFGPFKISAYAEEVLGFNENENTVEIAIFPNPTNDIVNIKASQEILKVEMFNVLGQKVLDIDGTEVEMQVDLSNQSTGVYIANITTESGKQAIRIVKQ